MALLARLSYVRSYTCRQCMQNQRLSRGRGRTRTKATWAGNGTFEQRAAQWEEQAARIHSGAQKSMLDILDERGFVKDVAGSRDSLDWLLTHKRIGAYVGVDPTAPSLHVGHLLPLMALYWMYLYGYNTITLLGGGTVQIGDPSGRTTARAQQGADVQSMNVESIHHQLRSLWTNVKCLGIKHNFPAETCRKLLMLNNKEWLGRLSAIDLIRDLGSGMRLGSMLARDSVKVRMETGEGMAFSEFSYPLFQAYDWWHMYCSYSVQLQLGGSDQYGNLCAGMDAVSHMRKIKVGNGNQWHTTRGNSDRETLSATFGLATPLLTTASGEKFGKSAGNAVWLDKDMMSSYDLYQYFLRTADDDVERYLKLFTFLPLDHISLVMAHHTQNESKRVPQHLLAKEVVELAHGAQDAMKAEAAHKDAFRHGTNIFSLYALRKTLKESPESDSAVKPVRQLNVRQQQLFDYKKAYAASSTAQSAMSTSADSPKTDTSNVVTLPLSFLRAGSFPLILYAAGLATSKTEGRRLIAKKGAYVVLPNSGSTEDPHALKWEAIPESINTADPNHYLVDFRALVLRAGKSKIQICRIVPDGQFEAKGLTCPGWEEVKAQRAEAAPQE